MADARWALLLPQVLSSGDGSASSPAANLLPLSPPPTLLFAAPSSLWSNPRSPALLPILLFPLNYLLQTVECPLTLPSGLDRL